MVLRDSLCGYEDSSVLESEAGDDLQRDESFRRANTVHIFGMKTKKTERYKGLNG